MKMNSEFRIMGQWGLSPVSHSDVLLLLKWYKVLPR